MEVMDLFRIGLAQVDAGAGVGELLGVAFGPLIVGLLMFFFGLMGERAGVVKPGIKWLGMVALVIGMVMGWDYFKKVTGEEGQTFIMLNMIEKKKYLYYAAFIAPLAGALLLPIWVVLSKRRAAQSLAEDEEFLDEEYEDAGEEHEYYEEDMEDEEELVDDELEPEPPR